MNAFCRLLLSVSLCFGLSVNAAADFSAPQLVQSARSQIGVTLKYDASYQRLTYPGGDVPQDRGVCTDVLIRALRDQALDLQLQVHEDMRRNFSRYPKLWGLRGPDRNIDHRRVPNLQRYFQRQGWELPLPANQQNRQAGLRAGDVLTWMLPGNLPHIGIVSDQKADSGAPLIIHNVGRGTQEEDVLHAWPLTGHYRISN